jgi:hypothetical protein
MLTVDELLDRAIEHACSVLVGKPEASLMPTWLIQSKDKTSIIGTPWDGEEDKKFMLFAMRMMLEKEQAQSYSFMSEAWSARENLNHPIGLPPSQREDKNEVVLINACDRQGGKMRIYEIKRNKKGVVTELALQKQGGEDQFSGRLLNLLVQ